MDILLHDYELEKSILTAGQRPRSSLVVIVKSVRHEPAGATEVNPATGKTIKGGEFAPAASSPIERTTKWTATDTYNKKGDRRLFTAPVNQEFWTEYRKLKQVSPGGMDVSVKKDDTTGEWTARIWRDVPESDRKPAEKAPRKPRGAKADQSGPKEPSTQFETRECYKCGGTGYIPEFAGIARGVCFACGGVGHPLTKRGQTAKDYYVDLTKVPASKLKAGMEIPHRVTTIAGGEIHEHSVHAKIISVDKSSPGKVKLQVTIPGGTTLRGIFDASRMIRRYPPPKEDAAFMKQAFAYQDTLTERGTVRKRAVASNIAKSVGQDDLTAEHHRLIESRDSITAEPTDAQKQAGNYRMGHVHLHGLDITIETPKGGIRSGKTWAVRMPWDYGYVRGTVGKDSDQVDVIIGPHPESHLVYVIDQVRPGTKDFDEHKCIIGALNEAEARQVYLDCYTPGWNGIGAITAMTMAQFKEWLGRGKRARAVGLRKEAQPIEKSVRPTLPAESLSRCSYEIKADLTVCSVPQTRSMLILKSLTPEQRREIVSRQNRWPIGDPQGRGGQFMPPDARLLDFVRGAITSKTLGNKAWADYRIIGKLEGRRLSRAVGDSFEGWVHTIDESAVKHMWQEHGGANEDDAACIPLTQEDIARIPLITKNPDKVYLHTDRKGRELICYEKRDSGQVYVYEERRIGRKKLAAVTMRILRIKGQKVEKGVLARGCRVVTNSVPLYVQDGPSPPSAGIIPRPGRFVLIVKAAHDVSAEPRDKDGKWTVSPHARPPKGVHDLGLSYISIDPKRFQFKNVGINPNTGVNDELKSVRKFDPDMAGVVLVWMDPANRKTYIVNGHHRYDLAKRLKRKYLTVRYIDAPNAEKAMLKGALVNLAEGRGEAVDAAKLFRSAKIRDKDLQAAGVSLSGALANQATGLSNLSSKIWSQVVAGKMTPGRGAVIGHTFKTAPEQEALAAMLARPEVKRKQLSDAAIMELAKFVSTAGRRTSTINTLFGEESLTQSLAVEKAQISAAVRAKLIRDKNLFAFVAKQGRADVLEKVGNRIVTERNREISEDAERVLHIYDKLSAMKGTISSALSAAAKDLASGKPLSALTEKVYDTARSAVSETLGHGTGRPEPGSGGDSPGYAEPPEYVEDTDTGSLF